jgi:hypothetical protein
MNEAFVYCWTDKSTNKLYIGSHKGSIEDGYVCSSKYMIEEYKKRPDDFTRQIIARGNIPDIRKLEAKILKSVDAKVNEEFYNRHNNDGFYFDGWSSNTMTEEHKKNIGKANKGRKISLEHAHKLHEGRRKSKNSPEHAAAVIASRVGNKHTDDTKIKMSKSRLANPNTKKFASEAGKISASKRPENYRELQSIRAKAAWAKKKEGIVNGD